MSYEFISHTHCWNQHYPESTHPTRTACGIEVKEHEQCCLCSMKKPESV